MLIKRALVTIVLLPIGIWAIVVGGWVYLALIALFLGLAAWEYVNLWRAGGFQPAGVFVVGGVLALALARQVWGLEWAAGWLSAAVLLSMVYHLVQYERGREQAASDLGITLMGQLYLGWIGAYLVSLRSLENGQWWVLLVLPAVWLADSGAYLIGSRFGRHPLTPRLSPKKTWEGYLGGVVFSVLGGLGLAALYRALGRRPRSACRPGR
jgi:phosphatidate cytidylyltransferase